MKSLLKFLWLTLCLPLLLCTGLGATSSFEKAKVLIRAQNRFLKGYLLETHYRWHQVAQAIVIRKLFEDPQKLKAIVEHYFGVVDEVKVETNEIYLRMNKLRQTAIFKTTDYVVTLELKVYDRDDPAGKFWDRWWLRDTFEFDYERSSGRLKQGQLHLFTSRGSVSERYKFVAPFGFGWRDQVKEPIRFKFIKIEAEVRDWQRIYTPDNPAQISLKHARQVAADASRIVVAVLDSGVNYNLPAIAHKLVGLTPLQLIGLGWFDKPLRSVGWDFENADPYPYDYETSFHNEVFGTFDHGSGVTYVLTNKTDEIAVLPLRTRKLSEEQMAEAVRMAAVRGARIMNVSMASGTLSHWEKFREAIRAHPQMIFVVAASNEGDSLEQEPQYPAAFEEPNLITVASVNKELSLSTFSSFSPRLVEVAAPGEDVDIIKESGVEALGSGTSFAAPYVSKLIALLWKRKPKLTVAEIMEVIRSKALQHPGVAGKVRSGIINPEVLFSHFGLELPEALRDSFTSEISKFCNDSLRVLAQNLQPKN